MGDQITISRSDLEELIKKQTAEGVVQALTLLGVDTKNPIEMQKDFQHLRDWRVTTTSIKEKSMLAALGLLVSGTAAALWIGVKEMVNK